jgi:hypothetical protein
MERWMRWVVAIVVVAGIIGLVSLVRGEPDRLDEIRGMASPGGVAAIVRSV